MADRGDIARYRRNWQEEVDAASTYRTLAEVEAKSPLAEVYRRMAGIEEGHASFWEQKLKEAGIDVGSRRTSFRARATAWVARRFGASTVLPMLSATEDGASGDYAGQPEVQGTQLAADESSHARILRTISRGPSRGVEGGTLARLEGRHKAIGGNALRAAVLGANDGLCSTLSLVMGVAGAGKDAKTILIAGLAGMLAGACAMAMGEWLSVQSSRELSQRQIDIEKDELKETPAEEQEELALIYEAKGLQKDEAQALAAKLMADKDNALDTLTREELGLDPGELGGSAWEAAITSFFLFIMGAIAPVAPFVFIHTTATAVIVSVFASAVMLFVIGAAITLMTGRSVLFSGIRQLIIGAAAAGTTFGVGRLIGMAVD